MPVTPTVSLAAVPPDEPEEDVLERRSDPFEGRQADTGRDDERQQAVRGGRLVRDRHQTVARPPARSTRSTHGIARSAAASLAMRRLLARVGFDPVEGQRVAGEQIVERSLGHQPAAGP